MNWGCAMWKIVLNHRSCSLYPFLPLKEMWVATYAPKIPFIKTQLQLHIFVGLATPRHRPPASSNYDSGWFVFCFVSYSQVLGWTLHSEIYVTFELCSLAGWMSAKVVAFWVFVKCNCHAPLCGLSGSQHYQLSTAFVFYFNCVKWAVLAFKKKLLGNKWANFPLLIKYKFTWRDCWSLIQKSQFLSIWGHLFSPSKMNLSSISQAK